MSRRRSIGVLQMVQVKRSALSYEEIYVPMLLYQWRVNRSYGDGKILTTVLCIFLPFFKVYDILAVSSRPSANSLMHSV